MKNKKVILSSILSLVLCLSLIVGGTFALFTSESKTNIAINSGKVELVATLENLQTYSIKANATNNGYDSEKQADGTFANGGTAVIEGGLLTLDRMTPGDKATFDIVLENKSDVAIQYQTIIRSLNDTGLFAGLTVMIEDEVFDGLTATSDWTKLDAEEQPADSVISVSVELPVDAENDYQATSTELLVTVNAVQGNAIVNNPNPDESVIELYTADDLVAFANSVNKGNNFNGKTVKLMNNVDMAGKTYTPAGIATAKFDGAFDGQSYIISNLNVSNSAYAGLFGVAWTSSVIENVSLKNVSLNTNHFAGAVVAHTYGDVKNCTVDGANIVCLPELVNGAYDNGDKVGGIAGWAACGEITGNTVKNTTIRAYRDLGGILGCNNADDVYTVVSSNTIENVTLYQDITYDCGKAESELYVGSFTGRNDQNESNVGEATIKYVRYINDIEGLKAFRDDVNAGKTHEGRTVLLTADIDLNNELWTPIGNRSNPFSGSFDGQGYTISNLYINKEIGNIAASNRQGLFGTIVPSGATYFQNLTLHNANVQGGYHVGAVIATSDGSDQTYTNNYLVVTDIKLTGNVKVEGWQGVGGVMGSGNMAEMSNITVDVEPGSYVSNAKGGPDWSFNIVGSVKGGGYLSKIDNIKSNMDVKGISCSIGGLFGIVGGQTTDCTVSNVYYSGTVTVKASIDAHGDLRQYQYNGLIIGAPRFNVTADQATCTSDGKLVLNTEDGTKISNDMDAKYTWGEDLFGASRDTTYTNKSYAKDYTGS